MHLAIAVFMLIFLIIAFGRWLIASITADVIVRMQQLVEKLKEYDLDTRAGLIICRSRQLCVHYIDPSLQRTLGRPSCVEDLLPVEMRQKHLRLVARYGGARDLPESLNHPLRNVQVLDKDGNTFCAKLIIGKFGRYLFQQLYYVIVQPNDQPSSISHSISLSDDARPFISD